MKIRDLISIGIVAVLFSSGTLQKLAGQDPSAPSRIFVFYSSSEDTEEFREYALQLARLKPYGRIDVCINSPALKSDFELPLNSCDWHEYASYNRSVAAFFPDSLLVPFVPGDFIERNREMLLYRAGVLRELGLHAAFRSNEPRFLPEAFFEKYPDLRGPRVDHPRRSVRKEFAPCFHRQETVKMYHNMVAELFRNVPGLYTFYFSMNDAGSGSCWMDWLYSGPNGPSFCKEINKSEGIISMLNVYRDEARTVAGHDIDIYFKGMFTDVEKDDLVKRLPEKVFLESRNYPEVKNISTMLYSTYPVRGILNPVQIIRTMSREGDRPERYIFDFWASYSRAHERIETITRLLDIFEENLTSQAGVSGNGAGEALKKICNRWAGPEFSGVLYRAMVELDSTISASRPELRGLSTLYWGVSARQITRPLVFAPQRLDPSEEKYFLPYVFNVSREEARIDYMDIHGGDREIPVNAVGDIVSKLHDISSSMEGIRNAPEQKFLSDMAKALRLYACVLQTCGNFNDAQIIRNRNREKLSRPVRFPDKTPTWTGDKDLQEFNAVMRNELDNTQEMIELLESGGMDLICTAKPPFPEDTFILGPDLISQLKTKRKVMLAHWTDIEDYLTTPFK